MKQQKKKQPQKKKAKIKAIKKIIIKKNNEMSTSEICAMILTLGSVLALICLLVNHYDQTQMIKFCDENNMTYGRYEGTNICHGETEDYEYIINIVRLHDSFGLCDAIFQYKYDTTDK